MSAENVSNTISPHLSLPLSLSCQFWPKTRNDAGAGGQTRKKSLRTYRCRQTVSEKVRVSVESVGE